MSAPEPTVYVVDDDEAIRRSLAMLLRAEGYRARTFASADAFLEELPHGLEGCLVLDIRMPGISGLDLQRRLDEMGCALPIVFITGHGDIPMAVQAVKAGAVDFLTKPFRDRELLDAIARALVLGAERRREVDQQHEVEERLARLTPREREVLTLVADGKPNKVIAFDLGLSERTVEIHRAHVMHKMQAESLAHLVRMVVRAG